MEVQIHFRYFIHFETTKITGKKLPVFSPKGFTFFGEIRFPLLFAQWLVERRSSRLAKRFRWHEEEGGGILYLGVFFCPTL